MKAILAAILSTKLILLLHAIQLIIKHVLMIGMTAVFIVLLFQLKSELGIDVFPDYNCKIDDWARAVLGL